MANPFYNLTLPEIASLRAKYLECLNVIAAGGQSYTVAGRQFTRASLNDVKKIIEELGNAQNKVAGKTSRRVYSDFRRY